VIRRFVDARPTYGYRQIAALVNRELAKQGLPPANHNRVYRIMKHWALFLERHTGWRQGRVHHGPVVVMRSSLRWCSDALEFTCWNGDIVRMALIIDAHDRETTAWQAVCGAGISGDMVRVVMLEAVEKRFAATRARGAPLGQCQRPHLQGDPRLRTGAQPGALLHTRSQPGVKWPGRGFCQYLQTRLCSRENFAGRRYRAPVDPWMGRGLQQEPSTLSAQNALAKGVHL